MNVVPHWLAIEGVQPRIPENPPPLPEENMRPDINELLRAPVTPGQIPGQLGAKRGREGGAEADGGSGTVMQPVVAHELSKELQLYFDRITAVILGGGAGDEAPLLRAALESLATDSGLHQLMPYFVQFVQQEVATSLKNTPRLRALINTVHSLVSNPTIHVELYLHQLMPSIVTCMVAKKLSASPAEDHWSLRVQAARTMAFVCRKFGAAYPTIQPRITRTLLRAMLDASKPLPTHFGAIVGLSALGPRVVRLLVLPNLKAYLAVLEPHLTPPAPPAPAGGDGDDASGGTSAENDARATYGAAMQKHVEARRTHDALKSAVGMCLHETLAAPQRTQRERVEPGRMAERLRAGDGADAAAAKAKASGNGTPASEVEGWVVGKAPAAIRVHPGRAAAVDAGGENGGKDSLEGSGVEGEIEDPAVIARQVAEAAALLGEDCLPYASNPAVAEMFL